MWTDLHRREERWLTEIADDTRSSAEIAAARRKPAHLTCEVSRRLAQHGMASVTVPASSNMISSVRTVLTACAPVELDERGRRS